MKLDKMTPEIAQNFFLSGKTHLCSICPEEAKKVEGKCSVKACIPDMKAFHDSLVERGVINCAEIGDITFDSVGDPRSVVVNFSLIPPMDHVTLEFVVEKEKDETL